MSENLPSNLLSQLSYWLDLLQDCQAVTVQLNYFSRGQKYIMESAVAEPEGLKTLKNTARVNTGKPRHVFGLWLSPGRNKNFT